MRAVSMRRGRGGSADCGSGTGAGGGVRSRWQKRHTLAASGTSDRQNGHVFVAPASTWASRAMTRALFGMHATMSTASGPNKNPRIVQRHPLRPFADAMAADAHAQSTQTKNPANRNSIAPVSFAKPCQKRSSRRASFARAYALGVALERCGAFRLRKCQSSRHLLILA